MKTKGGFIVENFKKLEKPIDHGNLEPHIYEGLIKDVPTFLEHIKDFQCTWDRFGRCSNLKRSDCFIDVATIKPLFISLKAEYFEDFEAGRKTKEYRVYGPRWNERTCTPGREVTFSYGYGKNRRLNGIIKSFEAVPAEKSKGFLDLAVCTGITGGMIAEIEIELTKN